jgi:hypothetical protein
MKNRLLFNLLKPFATSNPEGKTFRNLIALFVVLVGVNGVMGQASITSSSAVTDALAGYLGTTATVPANWTLSTTGTAAGNGINQTTGTAGGWYGNGNISFLGSGSASNGNATWLLQNNTGSIISGFTLAFTARLWKTGSNSPSVTVSYSNSGTITNPAAGALTNALSSLTFNDGTINVSTGAAMTQTVSGLTIANGQYIFVRFIHTGGSSSDNLGWDDLSFTPTLAIAPEINIKQSTTSYASASTYAFVNQVSGTSSSATTFTIENTGNATLNLSGSPIVAISGNTSEFTVDQTSTASTVATSGSTTFTVTFNPTSTGAKSAAISIANDDATGSESPYIINLTGTGTVNSIAAPQSNAASGVGATSFTANWDAVPGATGYEIDVYKSTTILASDLFISEYGEGTPGNRKYIEIFNGTGNNIDLSLYKLIRATNGGGFPSTGTAVVPLSGTLSNGVTYTIANNVTDTAGADIYNTNFTNWNGDDAIGLFKNDILIDVFGTPDIDPGTGWSIAGTSNATVDKIIVRKSTIVEGNTNWSASAGTTVENSEWIVSRAWDATDSSTPLTMGNHTFNSATTTYISQNQNVGNVTSYQVTGLDQNTTYYYVVRAKDATSESVNSNEITTTTAIVSTTYTTSWSNSAPTASIDAIINGNLTTTTDLVCKDLTINSGKTLTIAAGTTLTVSNNLVNNGSIVFKSNNTSTGRFGPYNGSATLGSVTMERYIDGKRAFRFLAPGVTTSGTIADNWQEQVFITGSTTGANGFDTTVTGAPSMFTYENSGWAPISNTDVLTLNAQKGYRILIRGDRTPSILTSPSNGTMNNPVTLTATGTMITGDVPYNTLTNQDYTLVANPYISPINWATVTKNNISDTYYAWDPNLGTGNQRGRYVSCDVAGNTSIISGTGSPSTDVDQFIQPGQAVFIQKTTSGVNGSVTIKETDKAATFTDVFRTPNNSSNAINGKLGVNLYESLAYSLGEYPIDGAVVVSGTTFNTNSASDDTKKIMSHGEQVAFVRDNIQLGIEKISAPQENDELSIACINLVPNKNYVWSVVLQDGFSNEDAYLYDAFTQMYHPLTGNSVITFNTTDDVNSSLVNRFKIVFQNAVLSNATFQNTLAIYPNPAKAGASFYVEGISEATVTVSNLLGQTVPVQTKSQGTTLQVTPNTNLSQGVYLVNITTQGTTQQVKWIVE